MGVHLNLTKQKGFTLAELSIAVAIMGFVTLMAVLLINLSVTALAKTEIETNVIPQDTEFAARLSKTIRESTTGFTMPEKSFKESKLEAGWNYLGLMDDVHIPAYASRTGKEISSAPALVYIEYAGDLPPAKCPANANLISTPADGYFIQYVLGHDYTDSLGVKHEYSLVFKPVDETQREATAITYEFSSDLSEHGGSDLPDSLDIDTMLNGLNAIQLVYRGSSTNPAVAVAFRSDFLPTFSVTAARTGKTKANVILVLDLSGSMAYSMTGGTRISVLKTAVRKFLGDLSVNDQINISIVPFSSYGLSQYNNSGRYSGGTVFNAERDREAAEKYLDQLRAIGGTNVGDGLRRAYYEMKSLNPEGTDPVQNFVVLMTDGEMNMYCINDFGLSRAIRRGESVTAEQIKNFYTGNADVPPLVVSPGMPNSNINTGSYWSNTNSLDSHYNFNTSFFGTRKNALDVGARGYMQYWANRIISEFGAKTYLLNYCDGMSEDDQVALQTAFNTTELFDVNSLTEFEEVFEQISLNISEVIWAFEGPRL